MAKRPKKFNMPYTVTWDKKAGRRFVWVNGAIQGTITKKGKDWYAGSCYHPTLRDAIIWLAYGIR